MWSEGFGLWGSEAFVLFSGCRVLKRQGLLGLVIWGVHPKPYSS